MSGVIISGASFVVGGILGLWIVYHRTGKNLMERIETLEYSNREQRILLTKLKTKAPEAFAAVRMDDMEEMASFTPFDPKVVEHAVRAFSARARRKEAP